MGFLRIFQFVFLIPLLLAATGWAAEPLSAEYNKQIGKQEWKKAAETLARWEKASPNDPELWAYEGDWWHRDAHRQETDEKYAASAERAAGYFEKALTAQPKRLDLWLSLCDVDLDLGDLGAFTDNAGLVARRAGKIEWTWESEKIQPDKPEQIIPDSMESWCWELSRDETKDSDDAAQKLAALSIQIFPNHPGGYRYLGRFYLDRSEWAKARDFLLKSCQLDGTDSESLLDLGRALWETERDEDAKACYRTVITLNNDPDAVNRARKELERAENEY